MEPWNPVTSPSCSRSAVPFHNFVSLLQERPMQKKPSGGTVLLCTPAALVWMRRRTYLADSHRWSECLKLPGNGSRASHFQALADSCAPEKRKLKFSTTVLWRPLKGERQSLLIKQCSVTIKGRKVWPHKGSPDTKQSLDESGARENTAIRAQRNRFPLQWKFNQGMKIPPHKSWVTYKVTSTTVSSRFRERPWLKEY